MEGRPLDIEASCNISGQVLSNMQSLLSLPCELVIVLKARLSAKMGSC